MSPLPGELFLVDLGMVGKVRPAVVLSREDPDSPRALAICAPLTTENRGSDYEVAIGKLKFLDRESWVNVQGLMSIGHEKLIRRLGRLTAPQMEQIKTALRFALDL
ncbi:MAG TPA: type II toxin-antitoxin system PemK/MazF family toxin [Opitutus sp.]|nr:type II toxin-antitoxin system PemK/MazF family toxin [Opitutus sp.]